MLRVVQDLISRLERISNPDEIGGLLLRIDLVKTRVISLGLNNLLLEMLNRAYNYLNEITANLPCERQSRGRPSIDVDEEQVSFLLEQNFKVAVD